MGISAMDTFWPTHTFPLFSTSQVNTSSTSHESISTSPWLHSGIDLCNPPYPAQRPPQRASSHLSFVHQASHESPCAHYRNLSNVYPSPPSTSSTSKYTVPLPEESDDFIPIFSSQASSVLDSPLAMRREDISNYKPLTPPPTLPHTLCTLPEYDDDPSFEYEDEEDENIVESSGGPSEDNERQSDPPEASVYSDSLALPLLSPLSPTWNSHRLCNSSDRNSDFVPALHKTRLMDDSQSPADPFCPPLWPPPLSDDMDLSADMPFTNLDDGTAHFPSLSSPPLEEPSQLLGFHNHRPLLRPLAIPWSSRDRSGKQPQQSSSTSYHDSRMEFMEPHSPSVSHLSLPDVDDEAPQLPTPASPCRRSCSSLPELDMDMDIDSAEVNPYPTPVSPSHTLISLPGADTDDELLPPPLVPQPFFYPPTPSQPLLFVDDPRDVPLPRSPSPEDFDLNLSSEDAADPELVHLYDLRKRSLAAERSARRMEALVDPHDLASRAETRRVRRKEKERSKEVGALLRIKLGDRLGSPCKEDNHRRRAFSSISQLVAQMVFRRNETVKPLTKRRTAAAIPSDHLRSPLSRSIVADIDGADFL